MRRLLLCVIAALSLVAVAGCDFRTMTPSGEGDMRYRDEVFSGVTRTNGVTYGNAVHQDGTPMTLKLNLFEPTGDTVTERPVIIFAHGGTFCCGSRNSSEIVDQANTFARKGYVTASISYRQSPNGCYTINAECVNAIQDAREDGQAAVRFFRRYAAQYGIDTTRIAMAGSSAGAITAVEVGYGPEPVGNSGNPGYDSSVKAVVSLSGARVLTNPDADEAAVLMFHNEQDSAVPYQWAVDTKAEADAIEGLHAELETWPGSGHVPYGQYRQQILDETTNFLWWTLNLANATV